MKEKKKEKVSQYNLYYKNGELLLSISSNNTNRKQKKSEVNLA